MLTHVHGLNDSELAAINAMPDLLSDRERSLYAVGVLVARQVQAEATAVRERRDALALSLRAVLAIADRSSDLTAQEVLDLGAAHDLFK